jgi:hypothetical protein
MCRAREALTASTTPVRGVTESTRALDGHFFHQNPRYVRIIGRFCLGTKACGVRIREIRNGHKKKNAAPGGQSQSSLREENVNGSQESKESDKGLKKAKPLGYVKPLVKANKY